MQLRTKTPKTLSAVLSLSMIASVALVAPGPVRAGRPPTPDASVDPLVQGPHHALILLGHRTDVGQRGGRGSLVGTSFHGTPTNDDETDGFSVFEELDESFGQSADEAGSAEAWWTAENQARLAALRMSLERSGANPLFLALLDRLRDAPGAFPGSQDATVFFDAVEEFLAARAAAEHASLHVGPGCDLRVATETYRAVEALTAMTLSMEQWLDEEHPWVAGLANHEIATSGQFSIRRSATVELAHQAVLSFAVAQAGPIVERYDGRARHMQAMLSRDPDSPFAVRAAALNNRRTHMMAYYRASVDLSRDGGKILRHRGRADEKVQSLACLDAAKDANAATAAGGMIGEGRNACALLRKLVSCIQELDETFCSSPPSYI